MSSRFARALDTDADKQREDNVSHYPANEALLLLLLLLLL